MKESQEVIMHEIKSGFSDLISKIVKIEDSEEKLFWLERIVKYTLSCALNMVKEERRIQFLGHILDESERTYDQVKSFQLKATEIIRKKHGDDFEQTDDFLRNEIENNEELKSEFIKLKFCTI